jgi:hypothetical protein
VSSELSNFVVSSQVNDSIVLYYPQFATVISKGIYCTPVSCKTRRNKIFMRSPMIKGATGMWRNSLESELI